LKSKLEQVLDIIQYEPNYETFEYKGYKIVIKRMMYLGGQLNGYVRIPKGHKFYDNNDAADVIECHGGITWAGKMEEEDNDFYIGFDTAHYQDLMPFMVMLDKNFNLDSISNGTYRDITYVRNECKSIVDQLCHQ
jgi:hypothetical protein